MDKINFQDGTKVSSAKVTIDEVDYPVTPARYTGATPLSSQVLNTMQDNIEDAIDQNISNIGGEEYDETAIYEEGDIVKYEGQLYICIEAIYTPEEWDSTKWNATDVLSSAGGNEVTIGAPEDITGKTKIFIDESEGTDAYSEVVNSLSGNEIAKAPSVRAVNGASVIVSATEPQGNDRRKVWKQHSKNLFSGIEVGGIDASGNLISANDRLRSKYLMKVLSSTKYTLSVSEYNSTKGTPKVNIIYYTNSNTFISTSGWQDVSYTFTTPNNCMYIRALFYLSNSSSQTLVVSDITEVQIEIGETATDYEPFVYDKEYISNENDVYEPFKEEKTLVEKRLVQISLASSSATNVTDCSITAPKDGLAIIKVSASFSGGSTGIRYVNIYGENGQLQAIANSQVANQNGTTAISGIEFVNVKEGATYMPRVEQTSGGALTVFCSIQMLYV